MTIHRCDCCGRDCLDGGLPGAPFSWMTIEPFQGGKLLEVLHFEFCEECASNFDFFLELISETFETRVKLGKPLTA